MREDQERTNYNSRVYFRTPSSQLYPSLQCFSLFPPLGLSCPPFWVVFSVCISFPFSAPFPPLAASRSHAHPFFNDAFIDNTFWLGGWSKLGLGRTSPKHHPLVTMPSLQFAEYWLYKFPCLQLCQMSSLSFYMLHSPITIIDIILSVLHFSLCMCFSNSVPSTQYVLGSMLRAAISIHHFPFLSLYSHISVHHCLLTNLQLLFFSLYYPFSSLHDQFMILSSPNIHDQFSITNSRIPHSLSICSIPLFLSTILCALCSISMSKFLHSLDSPLSIPFTIIHSAISE